jgi:hypothetical protein
VAILAALCAGSLMLGGCTTSILGGAAASAANSKAGGSALPPQVPDQKPDPKEAARLRVELASLYFSRGSIGPALDEASSAAKLDPENPQAYNLLGLINMQIKEDALATLNFERALRRPVPIPTSTTTTDGSSASGAGMPSRSGSSWRRCAAPCTRMSTGRW